MGARIRQSDDPEGQWRTVIGIVDDIRNDDADSPPLPYLYVPLAQQVTPTDPITLVATLAALAVVGLAATLGPALRAARRDPVAALRTGDAKFKVPSAKFKLQKAR